jgi:transcription-repair coupling factor (superfamily II helicase)
MVSIKMEKLDVEAESVMSDKAIQTSSKRTMVRQDGMQTMGPKKIIEVPAAAVPVTPSNVASEKVSVTRLGATVVGPSARPVTIFPGDYVVHRDKGIAQFADIVTDERWKGIELIRLNFKDAEYVVPPEERARISRLKASDASSPPKLTPLTAKGAQLWEARVREVRESAKRIAQDILALYASRNEITRPPCLPDSPEYDAFEAAFEYAPTPDQQTCFDDVARDMYKKTASTL